LKLALGTAQFGFDYGLANRTGKIRLDEATSILNYAWNNNIHTLDTAYAYGDSEKALGDIGVYDWKVISKLPSNKENKKPIKFIVEESLERLNIKKVYGVLFHRAEDLLEGSGPEIYRELADLKDAGVIEKIGVSLYSPIILDELIPNYDLDIIQAPMNILDNRLLKSGWISKLKNKGIELHARSAFLQGVLLMSQIERPETFNKWKSIWSKWDEFINKTGQDPAEVCLQWLLSIAEIDKVIVGIDNLSQLEKLINYSTDEISAEFIDLNCDDPLLLDPFNWNI
jgi:aryl-alcohol dehydrogenase-like predicted oxidoreductase